MMPPDPAHAGASAQSELGPGERSGPGFEGLRCPSCGAHLRARLEPPGRRLRCACGREFSASELRLPEAEGEPGEARLVPVTLMVHPGTAEGTPGTAGRDAGAAAARAELLRAAGGNVPQTMAPGAAPAPAAPRPAVRFGKYEILAEVARGGMGVVYRARQTGLNREVALKMLLAGEGATEDQVKRFLREAESAARLSHPNIVPIYDVGVEDGKHYYAMEFIHGESVAQIIDRMGAVPPRQALKIAREVAGALQYAHEQGIVHRDIKPANILIAPREGKGGAEPAAKGDSVVFSSGVATSYRALLADFGLAKDLSGENALTVSGASLGTPVYMSPEQADGDLKKVGPRSDVYSLGAVLYEMVTGQEPFEGASVGQVLAKVIATDPVPPRRRSPNLHRDVETIIQTAMAKEAGRRYASAQALADDIDRYLKGEAIEARPASLVYRAGKFVRRNRALSAAAVLAPIILGVAGVWAWVESSRRAAEARGRAVSLAEEGRRLLGGGKTEEAERAFESALVLAPGFPAAREGAREARLQRQLSHARELLREKNYKAAGFILQEALSLAPDDPEVRRLHRIQLGTAVLEVSAEDEGLEAFFASASPGIPWNADTLPGIAEAVRAGILERLGPLPLAAADRPFGDGWLVLGKGGRVQASVYLRIPREAQVVVRRKVIRVEPVKETGPIRPPPVSDGRVTTITAALMAATPGTVIEVAPGTYRENLQITKPGITIRALPGERPEVGVREQGPALWAYQAPGLRVEGFSFQTNNEVVVVFNECPGSVFAGNRVSGGTGFVVSFDGSPDSLILENEVRDGKEPGITISNSPGAIVAGNHVHHVGWYGVGSGAGSGVTYARNRVHDTARCGFFCNCSEGFEVLENVFYRNEQWGICVAERTKNALVRGNLVFDTVYHGTGQTARGIQYGSSEGGEMSHNTVCRSTVGVWLQNVPGLVCRDNLVARNEAGIIWWNAGPVDRCCFFANRLFAQLGNDAARDWQALREGLAARGIAGSETAIEADPRFADAPNDDFSLLPDSPCRGAASDGADIGADGAVIREVLEGKFDRARWLKALTARRLVEKADRAKKPAEEAAFLRQALALRPGDAALKARWAAVRAKAGPGRAGE